MQIFEAPEQARAAIGECVATIGKYDGLHLGHQRILHQLLESAAQEQLPALVILSEPQPEEFFAPDNAPPRLNHFLDKVAFLESMGISAVLRLNFDESLSGMSADGFVRDFLVARLGVRQLIVGDDFRFGKNRGGDINLLRKLAAELAYAATSVAPCLSATERVSSTLIRDYLQQGDCQRVSQLLGRPYSISGEVILGRQLGRQIGTPTANVQLHVPRLPLTGVYAVRVELDGELLDGVANIGYKPTVTDSREPSLEVHLLDFDRDIYGATIKVSFLEKIRDEIKFNGLDELKQQIAQDLRQGRSILKRCAEAKPVSDTGDTA